MLYPPFLKCLTMSVELGRLIWSILWLFNMFFEAGSEYSFSWYTLNRLRLNVVIHRKFYNPIVAPFLLVLNSVSFILSSLPLLVWSYEVWPYSLDLALAMREENYEWNLFLLCGLKLGFVSDFVFHCFMNHESNREYFATHLSTDPVYPNICLCHLVTVTLRAPSCMDIHSKVNNRCQKI